MPNAVNDIAPFIEVPIFRVSFIYKYKVTAGRENPYPLNNFSMGYDFSLKFTFKNE